MLLSYVSMQKLQESLSARTQGAPSKGQQATVTVKRHQVIIVVVTVPIRAPMIAVISVTVQGRAQPLITGGGVV